MTRIEAVMAWLQDRGHLFGYGGDWLADLVQVGDMIIGGTSHEEPWIGLKKGSSNYLVIITESQIHQLKPQHLWREKPPVSMKIDMSSPKFFKVLLRAMKGNMRRGQEV